MVDVLVNDSAVISTARRPTSGKRSRSVAEGRVEHPGIVESEAFSPRWGILLLVGVGYAWLVQVGVGVPPASRLASTLTSVLFGVGSALTLDEFAIWFNLADVYWAREGRESVDAVALFGSALVAGLLGSRFFAMLVARRARSKRRGDTPPPE